MKTKQDHGVNFTVRLPKELAAFVEGLADQSCNTSAGILRLAVTKLRQSAEQPAGETADNREPEMAGCH